MLGKSPIPQSDLFRPLLIDFINLNHELIHLSTKIDWSVFEQEFSVLYSNTGTPSKPIRLMTGLLILKQMYNLGDETLIPSWIANPYFQYFCGEVYFQHSKPCDPSDLVHFRKRIGVKGIETIFQQSMLIHGSLIEEKEICVDTSAQEKNITFPTDMKLHVKIIKKCNRISTQEGFTQRQTYTRTVKEMLIQSRFAHHPKRKKQARKAQRKIKTIAWRLVRELERNASEKYQEQIALFKRVLNQQRHQGNKIYSLHEPDVACIAKGKVHKPYEFGSKVSLAVTKNSGIIVGAVNFTGNPNDNLTMPPTLDQHERLTGTRAQVAIVDRGYAQRMVGTTQVIKPNNGKNASPYEKQKARKRFRRRAAIEPVFSHIKHRFRMARNFLKGAAGDQINLLMAAAAFNFKKWMNKFISSFICLFDFICNLIMQGMELELGAVRKVSC
jgi:transposase, IS5 family